MAYVKQNWECGEVISADKLNHMEDGIANAGGDCDCGFECTEVPTTLTEETVTTTAQGDFSGGYLSYSQFIDVETLIVTFDGTEYECPRIALSNIDLYGGFDPTTGTPDFSNYPFAIASNGNNNTLITQSAGAHTVKVEKTEITATITPCFRKAVELVIGGGLRLSITRAVVEDDSVTYIYDHTWQEVHDALERGAYVTYQDIGSYDAPVANYWRILWTGNDGGPYAAIEGAIGSSTYLAELDYVMDAESPHSFLTITRPYNPPA